MKKSTFIVSGLMLGLLAFTGGAMAAIRFTDVPANHWATGAIEYVANAGLMKGDEGKDTFRPNANLTRAEEAVILQRQEQQWAKKLDNLQDQINQLKSSSSSVTTNTSNNSNNLLSLNYHSIEYGFNLQFPEAWKGYTTKSRQLDWGTIGKTNSIDFGFADQDALFNLSIFTPTQWDALQKADVLKPVYLGQGNGYVFGASKAQYVANDEMKKRMEEVNTIFATFNIPVISPNKTKEAFVKLNDKYMFEVYVKELSSGKTIKVATQTAPDGHGQLLVHTLKWVNDETIEYIEQQDACPPQKDCTDLSNLALKEMTKQVNVNTLESKIIATQWKELN